ncbi:CHAT domain-containing protein [Saccharomonospora marina]|uniref:CHAT domain-containing protein n=1 Tax=Saccharomonospora marina TaxID=632569 RepID=UPI0005944223|nr:CHAT domain-containing tetratricopeptide repeat protein [Saccharomonospora marina]
MRGGTQQNRDLDAVLALHRKANDSAASAHNIEAIRLLRKALRLIDAEARPDPAWVAARIRVLISLALATSEVGSTAKGFRGLRRAQAHLEQLPEGRSKQELQAVISGQRALLLFRVGRPAESLALFDAIIPTLERLQSEDGLLLARTMTNRAQIHAEMGDVDAAARDFDRAIELAAEHGLARIEGKARHGLGDLAQLAGDIPGALHHYEEAARILESVAPGWLARVRLDQARALLVAGLAREAARHLDEALPDLRRNRVIQDLAEAKVARAAAALLEGDYDLARHLAVLARRRFLRRGNKPWAEVAALARLRADATEVLESAATPPARLPSNLLRVADRLAGLGLRDETAAARLLAVRLLVRRGAFDAAAEQLAKVPKPRRTSPVDHKMLLRLCRAELAVATGRPRSALAQARAGLTELGWARDRMGGLDLLCGTAVHGQELGALAVGHVLARARGQQGARRLLAWQERTRAQVYRYEPLPAIDDPVLARYLTEMRHVQRTVQQHRLTGKPVAALESRYAWLQREASRLGWYTSRWGRPRPVCSPEEVAQRLGGRTLVSLVGHADSLAAVVVRDGRFNLVRLGSLSEVVETARQLHADLHALAPDQLPTALSAAVSASARRRAALLDERLIRPLSGLIGDTELVIVPTGSLHALPWPALPSLRGRPLSVAPSATVWVAAARAGRPEPVVLVGGPGVPGAVGEVRQLRTVYPSARLVDGEAATSETVLSALEGSGVAHLVAHGAHEPGNALFSRLDLIDGPLFAHEAARLSNPPQRVVLAACELAMSHIRPGEEALGFAGALLASGSRTVVGAVARVGDSAAAQAMTDLHRSLAAGLSPAVALAQATAVDPLRRPFLCLGAG